MKCHYVLVSYISHEKQVVVYLPEVIKQIAYSMSFLHQLPNLFSPMFIPIFFPRNHPPRASNLVKKSQGQPSTSDMSAQPLKFSDSVRHCKKTSKETSPRFSALKAAISARISLPDMTWTNMVEKKNMGGKRGGFTKKMEWGGRKCLISTVNSCRIHLISFSKSFKFMSNSSKFTVSSFQIPSIKIP